MKDRLLIKLGNVILSYIVGYEFRELKECLLSYVIEVFKEGIINFDKKIKGYGNDDVVLIGIEIRILVLVRIYRNEILESINVSGLYLIGEGVGFVGGIIFVVVDGIKVVEYIIKKFDLFRN